MGGGPRWLLVSSTAVYGQDDGAWVGESSPCAPQRFNGRVLLEAETALQAYDGACIVRLAGLYGPGRGALLQRILDGATCQADPPYWTNRIHMQDACALLAHLMTLPQVARCYVGVDDAPSTQCEVSRWLAAQLSAPPPRAIRGQGSNKRISNR